MNPEILGLTSSCIILLAGCMQDEERLRIVDSFGSMLMAVYGILISSLSVVFLNACLMVAHIYRIWKIEKRKTNVQKRN